MNHSFPTCDADIGPPYRLLIVVARHPPTPLSDACVALADQLPVVAWLGDDSSTFFGAVVSGSVASDEVAARVRIRLPIGWLSVDTGEVESVGEATTKYQHVADLACLVSEAAFDGCTSISEPEFAALRAVASIPLPSRAAFVRSVLGPVLKLPVSRAERLVAVLQGLARGWRISEIARHLHVHVKTVAYRKAAIRSLTGFDPGRGPSRAPLLLALHLWQLDRSKLPSIGSSYWGYGTNVTGRAGAGRTPRTSVEGSEH